MRMRMRMRRRSGAVVLTLGLVLSGCGGGGGSSGGAANPNSDSQADGSSNEKPAIDQLDDLIHRLPDAVADMSKPLDEADEIFIELEEFVQSVGEESKEEVVGLVVSVVNTGEASVSVESTLDEGVIEAAKELGLKLRDFLASLKQTPERAKVVLVALKDTLVQLPVLGAKATASAQLATANPFAKAEVKAQATADLERINKMIAGVHTQVAEVQQQAVALPAKASGFLVKAQQILMGAALSPPEAEPPPVAVASVLEDVAPVCPEQPPQTAGEVRPFQWGWFALSGVSAVVTGIGAGALGNANSQIKLCETPGSAGCSNYDQLRSQRDTGIILLTSGASLTAGFLLTGIVTNAGRDQWVKKTAGVACVPGFGGMMCEGSF